MTRYDDWYEWEGEQLNQHAVYQLVQNHRDEYEQLTGEHVRDTILDLERQIVSLKKQVSDLRALNPLGTNVPALQETVQILVDQDTARARKRKKGWKR